MRKINLGKMEPDYSGPVAVGEKEAEDSKHKMVERFPTVYISHEDLPKLEPGETVTLTAKVVEFGERNRKVRKDGETEHEEHRNVELDVTEIHVDKAEEDDRESDEDAVDKGLDEATSEAPDDDEGEDDDEEEE